MANTLTPYIPTIIAKTIPILRETLEIQKHVTRDYDSEFASVGSSLQIPITAQVPGSAITPSSTPPALTSLAPSSVTLTLNNFYSAKMSITSSDLSSMMRNTDFVPAHLAEAARTVARQIVNTLWQNYINVPYYVGTAGTNPFSTSLTTLSNAALSMNQTLASKENRVMLTSNNAWQGAGALGNLIQAFQRGSADTLNTGDLGQLEGFTMKRDSQVPTQTAGTGAGYTTPVAVTTIGATSMTTLTGTGTMLPGDIFTVAGDTQTYVVTGAGITAPGLLTFYPPAQVAWASAAAITLKATHVVNLGLEPGAFALAMRQPRTAGSADGMSLMERDGQLNVVIPFSDDVSGMQFFLSMVPGYWAQTLEVGALWGSCTLRPERAVRMAG